MYLRIVALLYLPFSLFANNWACTELASQRIQKNVYFVCGVAENSSLQKAREEAMKSAYREFEGLCKHSYDCNGHQKTITPKRTQCEKTKEGIHRCFRGFRFFITDKKVEENIDEELLKLKKEYAKQEVTIIKKEQINHLKNQIEIKKAKPIKKTITSLMIGTVSSEVSTGGSLTGTQYGFDFQYVFSKRITGGIKYTYFMLEEDLDFNNGTFTGNALHLGMNYYLSDDLDGLYAGLYLGNSSVSISMNDNSSYSSSYVEDTNTDIITDDSDFTSLFTLGLRFNFNNTPLSTIIELAVMSSVGDYLDTQTGLNTSLAFRY